MHATCERAAREALRRGWSVLPVQARGKRPLLRWEIFQTRHATDDEIRSWFTRWPDANLGIVTGAISALIVVDIDPRHGGADSMTRLEARHGSLPATVQAITGGGGRHLYFRHPGGVVRNRVGLADGIDLRGDGGYVVAPPSLHPSGRSYVWATACSPAEVVVADPPRWLIASASGGERAGRPVAYWRQLAREGVAEGERNTTLASFSGHLLWHGVDPDVVIELLRAWNRVRCRPPLDDAEVVQVVNSICRRHRLANPTASTTRSGDAASVDDSGAAPTHAR